MGPLTPGNRVDKRFHAAKSGFPKVKKDNPAKHFIAAFLIAVVIYAVAYGWIEHRRNRKGPWEVTFSTGFHNAPILGISQPALGITNFQIMFSDEKVATNQAAGEKMVFNQPRLVPFEVPFGKCIFMDLTFLPGTVTFSNVFGHQIELLPRVLIIDYKEYSWTEKRLTVSRSP